MLRHHQQLMVAGKMVASDFYTSNVLTVCAFHQKFFLPLSHTWKKTPTLNPNHSFMFQFFVLFLEEV